MGCYINVNVTNYKKIRELSYSEFLLKRNDKSKKAVKMYNLVN